MLQRLRNIYVITIFFNYLFDVNVDFWLGTEEAISLNLPGVHVGILLL